MNENGWTIYSWNNIDEYTMLLYLIKYIVKIYVSFCCIENNYKISAINKNGTLLAHLSAGLSGLQLKAQQGQAWYKAVFQFSHSNSNHPLSLSGLADDPGHPSWDMAKAKPNLIYIIRDHSCKIFN